MLDLAVLRQELSVQSSLPQLVRVDVARLIQMALRCVSELGRGVLRALDLELRVTKARVFVSLLDGTLIVVLVDEIAFLLQVVIHLAGEVRGCSFDAATVVDQRCCRGSSVVESHGLLFLLLVDLFLDCVV